MPVPTFNKLGPYPEFKDLVNKTNTIVAELQNLMVSLDTLNIRELNASVITALSITADKIAVGTITADKMDVTELSAISANLGTITAGIINAVTINAATIDIEDDVTIGNNLSVGFGANDRLIALGQSILSHTEATAILGLLALSGINLTTTTGDIVLNPVLGDVIIQGTSYATTIAGKQDSFTGLTQAVGVIDSDGVTPKTLNFTNGVLTSIT